MKVFDDTYFMRKALSEAEEAFRENEVPVGAVVVANDKMITKSRNATEQFSDVTAHAEIIAITGAAQAIGSKYLEDCTMYVTLEPCVMCAGALYWSRIGRLVIAASDSKRGFSQYGKLLHPKTKVEFGLMEQESSTLLRRFFEDRRKPF